MNNNDKQFVMLHDEKRCIGCQACTVACKVINDIPEGFSRLQVQIQGPHDDEAGNPHYQFFRVSCQHCEDAPCVSVCPTGASFIDENGIVQVKKELVHRLRLLCWCLPLPCPLYQPNDAYRR